MEINLFVNDDSFNSHIVTFFMQFKRFKFEFQELSNVYLLHNQRKLIVLKENFLMSDFKKKLKKNISFFSKQTCFFLPKKYNKADLNINANIINYPVKSINFENNLLNLFKRQKILFKNLELKNDNVLFNNDNNKQTHLTEIEYKIILFLFENDIVDKKTLNRKVLNQLPIIDSKSLESHLYRVRKKLNSVDSKKKIVLIENQGLKLG